MGGAVGAKIAAGSGKVVPGAGQADPLAGADAVAGADAEGGLDASGLCAVDVGWLGLTSGLAVDWHAPRAKMRATATRRLNIYPSCRWFARKFAGC